MKKKRPLLRSMLRTMYRQKVIQVVNTAKDTNKNIYLVTVTVQEADKPKHNKIITVEIEVLY